MTCWPVIHRELRVEARQAWNYWLRVLGATVVTVICLAVAWNQPVNAAGLGSRLFGKLNATLFVLIWLLVPLLTADCLSRERREGTLGLLFLTPLTGLGIVLAKSIIHGLRGLTVLLAAVPVMAFPFLIGGISRVDLVTALSFDLAALSLALAAGLLASGLGKRWARVMVLAELLSLALAGAFGVLTLQALPINPLGISVGLLGEALNRCTGVACLWSQALAGASTATYVQWYGSVAGIFLLSLLSLAFIVQGVALRINRTWQQESLPPWQLKLLRTFCTPVLWKALLRRLRRAQLQKNPIGWLHQYFWSARLTCWGWCMVVILLESSPSKGDITSQRFVDLQLGIACLLLSGMAFSAAASFHRERENGVLGIAIGYSLDRAANRVWPHWGVVEAVFTGELGPPTGLVVGFGKCARGLSTHVPAYIPCPAGLWPIFLLTLQTFHHGLVLDHDSGNVSGAIGDGSRTDIYTAGLRRARLHPEGLVI